jgi:putative ABC transport system substrate-binding protein
LTQSGHWGSPERIDQLRESAGFVASLGRPGGNVTGITFFGGTQLNAKRIELLHELAPKATTVAVLGDPGYPAFDDGLLDLEVAARSMGLQIVVARATRTSELDPAFTKFTQANAGALLVSGSPFFTSERTIQARSSMQLRRLQAHLMVASL